MSDSVQLADQYLINKTIRASEPTGKVSSAKSIVVVPDGNQGTYSGLITFDASSQLAGQTKFSSLEDTYLVIPYTATMKVSGKLPSSPNAFNRFTLCPKFNVSTIIDSIQVELNNNMILTENSYKQYWANVRAWTETTQDDVAKHGVDRMLFLDSWMSINHTSGAIGLCGDGYCNNQVNRVVSNAPNSSSEVDMDGGNSQEPHAFNGGYFKRLLNHAPVVIDASESNAAFSWPSFGTKATKEITQQLGKSCFKEFPAPTVVAATSPDTGNVLAPGQNGYVGSYFWVHKIRLADLHPLFEKLPLTANCQLKLRIRMNQGKFSIIGGQNGYSLQSSIMSSGNTCPIMVSATSDSNPLNGRISQDTVLTVAYGAIKNEFSNPAIEGDPLPFKQAQLYVPLYEIENPTALISSPTKTIRYLDCYPQMWQKQAGLGLASNGGQHNTPFTLQAAGAHKNVKYVCLLPFAETSSGNFFSAHGTPQYQSPMDSAPGTLQPGSAIRNFQVAIGGDSVFNSHKEYDFQSFRDEVCKLNAVNGDLSKTFNCGILDENQWSLANRMLVCDVSRHTHKDVPASVVVSGVNGSAQGSDLLLLIIYERELEIDVLTGEVYSST